MKINRTSSLKINIAKALLAIFIVFGFVLPAMAADEPEWIWTKNNPKPSWWKWGKDYYPEKPVRGGVMHYATTRGAGLMNPNHWPVNNFPLLSGIYDRLIYPEGQHLPKVPWLAKRWEYEDPTTIVMYLRKGVTFHDGSKFDAHSLKLQVDWINDKKNAAWSRNWIKPLKSIEVIDDYTVRWRTKKVWAGFYDIFANVPGWLLSPKALLGGDAKKDAGRLKNKIKLAERKVGKAQKKVDKASGAKAKKANKKLKSEKKKLAKLKKDLAKAMSLAEGARDLDEWAVGSGPWMMDDRRPDNYIKLKRNPNWWFGKSVGHPDMPYMDGAVYTVIPELSVKLANLKAGKIDTLTIDYSQYPQVKNDPKLDVWITPANSTLWLAFNEQGVFKDIRLRKAVSHADRKSVV